MLKYKSSQLTRMSWSQLFIAAVKHKSHVAHGHSNTTNTPTESFKCWNTCRHIIFSPVHYKMLGVKWRTRKGKQTRHRSLTFLCMERPNRSLTLMVNSRLMIPFCSFVSRLISKVTVTTKKLFSCCKTYLWHNHGQINMEHCVSDLWGGGERVQTLQPG